LINNNKEMPMIIYIVAGERNCKVGAVSDNGGLWANVGQTDRSPQERLLDDDYRKKAAGGKWLILAQFDVGENVTDHDVHKYLKTHQDVRWDASSNTEEFLFTTDDGTGQKAKEIVGDFLHDKSLPMLVQTNRSLRLDVLALQLRVEQLSNDNERLRNTDEGRLQQQYQELGISLKEKAEAELAEKTAELAEKEARLALEFVTDLDKCAGQKEQELSEKYEKMSRDLEEGFQRKENELKQYTNYFKVLADFIGLSYNGTILLMLGIIGVSLLIAFIMGATSNDSRWHKFCDERVAKVTKEKDKEIRALKPPEVGNLARAGDPVPLENLPPNMRPGWKDSQNKGSSTGTIAFDLQACNDKCNAEYKTCMEMAFKDGQFDTSKTDKCLDVRGENKFHGCLLTCTLQDRAMQEYNKIK